MTAIILAVIALFLWFIYRQLESIAIELRKLYNLAKERGR